MVFERHLEPSCVRCSNGLGRTRRRCEGSISIAAGRLFDVCFRRSDALADANTTKSLVEKTHLEIHQNLQAYGQSLLSKHSFQVRELKTHFDTNASQHFEDMIDRRQHDEKLKQEHLFFDE